jgi:hypothetical protein
MGFFKSDPPPVVTGTDKLREAARAKFMKGPKAALLARDLQIGVSALDEFAHGQGTLPPKIMTALARDFFGDNCSFDPERDLLVRTPAPSVSMGNRPAPLTFKPAPTRSSAAPGAALLNGLDPPPKPNRAGWAE